MKLMGREKLIERMKLFQMTEEQKKLTTMRTGMVMKQRLTGRMTMEQWKLTGRTAMILTGRMAMILTGRTAMILTGRTGAAAETSWGDGGSVESKGLSDLHTYKNK